MTKYIYDERGNAVGYILGNFIHSMNGSAIGQISGTHVHKLSGAYVGELHKDMVVDMHMGIYGDTILVFHNTLWSDQSISVTDSDFHKIHITAINESFHRA